ncbi:MAG TPA: hypothetical protein VF236_03865 [Gaiellaceae bacterium]
MRLLGSAALVVAGAILILFVSGSVRGIDANTIGAILLLVGFVSALAVVALRTAREEGARRADDDQPAAFPRR